MKNLLFFFFYIAISISAFPREKRLALVIGNSAYKHAGVLRNPVNDAYSMEEALSQVGFDVLVYYNLDQAEMKRAIDEFGFKLRDYDVGLFYYAGHGIQSKGINYLIPVSANLISEQQVEYDCVRADRVLGSMDASDASVNIMILDACRNNPFERSWSRSGAGMGLAFMNAPSGTLIAYATAPGTTASDGSGKNGLYTEAILENMNFPDLNILQMFQNVRSTVSIRSDRQQIPWESTSLIGDFYINPSGSIYGSTRSIDLIIKDYVVQGLHSESILQISDALRCFNWAYMLLGSLEDHPERKMIIDGQEVVLQTYLPAKIKEVLQEIEISAVESLGPGNGESTNLTLSFSYQNRHIQGLDYSYQYLEKWSPFISISNGLGIAEVVKGEKENPLVVKIKYDYPEKAVFDMYVQAAYNEEINHLEFYDSEKSVSVSPRLGESPEKRIEMTNLSEKRSFDSTVKRIVKDIQSGNEFLDRRYYTRDGEEAFRSLIGYGKATILNSNIDYKVIRINEDYMVRSIPVAFNFTNAKFTEDVILMLNEDGKLDGINFSISQIAIKDILSREERFANLEEKYLLIRFMENYKTAYCLKSLDYIKRIFDDEALIIIGKVVEHAPIHSDLLYSSLQEEEITYIKRTKEEYIRKLQTVFNSNEFINIHFEDNVVKKAKRDAKIFGIQISQHYSSSNYSDKGYLFLMVDLRDLGSPVVHVRTWQPRKNKNGTIYGIQDFPFESI